MIFVPLVSFPLETDHVQSTIDLFIRNTFDLLLYILLRLYCKIIIKKQSLKVLKSDYSS